MSVNDALGKRIKECYEQSSKTRLVRRMPVIIRIDGKAFHTFTRGFRRPFDSVLMETMQQTTKYLCENIQGCVLGYTQSDEISLLLIDYKRFNSSAWFDNEVQKICSISASMATMWFNRVFKLFSDIYISQEEEKFYREKFNKAWNELTTEELETIDSDCDLYKLIRAYDRANYSAMFDARCFNIPKEEVTNYFYWRQLDATRNSIEMVGQAYFSHRELHKKSCNMIQDMLHEQKGINWNDFSIPEKRGTCCIKETYYPIDSTAQRTKWIIDKEIPIFKGDDRFYIDRFIEPEET